MRVFLFTGIFFLSLIGKTAFAQSNHEKFNKLFEAKDTTKMKVLLAEWEKSGTDDAEFYTSAFNFYFANSKKEMLSLQRQQQSKESLQLTDSLGNVAGYLGADVYYDDANLNKAIMYVNKGIAKFPKRLDIRLGKCYALQQVGDYEPFTKEVIKTVEYSTIIKNKWLWTNNKKLEDPENYMLQAIHTYLKELYDTEDDALLENMKQIGGLTIKYYPDNIEILSTTAVANMLTKNYDQAITYLKHAETLNPKDFIVLNNIAHGYKLKGDKKNAIKYYELTEKYGDDQAKQQAKKNLNELK